MTSSKQSVSRCVRLVLAILTLTVVARGYGQDSDLVERLRGSAKYKTRSLFAEPEPLDPEIYKTRSLVFKTRGVPAEIEVAVDEGLARLETTSSRPGAAQVPGTVALAYTVDTSSEVTRTNILFQRGSTDFADRASIDELRTLGAALNHESLTRFQYVIEGHASADGSASYNQVLSQRRAARIADFLIGAGVKKERLLAVGFGETEARFPEDAREALRSTDRRVVIYRLEKGTIESP